MAEAKGQLPDDFPGREALRSADINTYGQVRKADLTSISGIGDATAAKIEAAVAEADAQDSGTHGESAPNPEQTADAAEARADYIASAEGDLADARQAYADATKALAQAEAEALKPVPEGETDPVTVARRNVDLARARVNAAENAMSARSTWTADQHAAN